MIIKKIAIFASGSGSNAQSIIEYFHQKENIEVAVIVSNNSDAFVIQRAKKLGVNSFVFNIESFKNNLLKIPEYIIDKYDNRILNIHPSLLPKYGGKGMYGKNVHHAVVNNKEPESGISIHYVNKNYDEGKIIFQARCLVNENDSAEVLSKKIQALEHKYYPKIIEETITKKNK